MTAVAHRPRTLELDHVVLLDDAGRPCGTASRESVHSAGTPLHLAFSCYLLDRSGRVLMTRRSLTKRSWPGVWTNSFCGHPRPGEALADAARRHARTELGVHLRHLEVVLPDFRYRAVDAHGIVENELCPVLIAATDDDVRPDPTEVAEHAWVAPVELGRLASAAPWAISPWAAEQIALLADLTEEAP